MEHRTKQDLALTNLVSDFEVNSGQGKVKNLDIQTFGQLIAYYENDGLLSKAIEVCKLALRRFKYRAEFYISLANLLLKAGKTTECFKYIDKAESIAPYEKEIVLLKARAYCANCQFTLAFDCLETIREFASSPEQVDILLVQARIYAEMKSFDDMYDALVEALRIDPTNERALDQIWIATELSRKYIQSVAFHQELLDVDPYNYKAWFNVGHAYAYQGEYENAIDAMEYSFIINADFEEGYMDCADICSQIKKHDQALAIYEEALEVFGVDSDLLTKIAECQIHLDRAVVAKQNLYKAVRLDPHNDEVYFLLGECYSSQGEWYGAINAYHKAIALEDGCEDYYLGLARAYIAVEEYNKATINFQLSVSVGPEQTKYWQEFASFLIKMGLYDEALQVLDEAEDFTFGADLMYIRALANMFLEDRSEGIAILQDALLEDFNQHPILFSLAPELEVDADISSMINYYRDEDKG